MSSQNKVWENQGSDTLTLTYEQSLATPLHFATLDSRIDMARELLNYGASLTVPNCVRGEFRF